MSWRGQERFRKAVLDARNDGMTMDDIAEDVPAGRGSVYRMMDDRLDFEPTGTMQARCERFAERRLGPSQVGRSNSDDN